MGTPAKGKKRPQRSRPSDGPRVPVTRPFLDKWNLAGALILALLVAIVYWPAFFGDFVWDDHRMLVDNPMVRQPDGIVRMWISTDQPDYWPLSYSTHWMEWRLWGANAAGYRALNILLHFLNVLLLWRLLRVLSIPGAWFAAALFAAHPVNVEAVVWILQRKTLLAQFWSLLSLLAILEFDATRKRSGLVASLLFLVLALLSKSSAVMVPPLMLLCLWWRHRQPRWGDLIVSVPFFAIALILGSVGAWFQRYRAVAQDNVRSDGFASRFALAGDAVWFYLSKAYWPTELSFVYPRWTADTSSARAYLSSVAILTLLLIFWILRRRGGAPPFFALACYLVALFPALGFVNIYFMRYSLVADHWQYHALSAALAFAIAGCFLLKSTLPEKWSRAPLALPVAAILFLAWLARAEARIYATNESLWIATLERNPGAWLAHNELGALYAHQGRDADAVRQYEDALALNPDYADARNNLANAMVVLGRLDDALEQLQRAVRLDPNSPEIHNSIGRVLGLQGRVKESIPYFEEALLLRPMFGTARRNLGLALELTGNHREAARQFRLVLKFDPGQEFAAFHLARLLLLGNDPSPRDTAEGIALLESLCRQPTQASPQHLDLLSAAYSATGRLREAIQCAELAVRKYAEAGNGQGAELMQRRLEQLRSGNP